MKIYRKIRAGFSDFHNKNESRDKFGKKSNKTVKMQVFTICLNDVSNISIKFWKLKLYYRT